MRMQQEYLVTTNFSEIDFAPPSVEAEVLQNVRTIITTVKGSVPLDRGFGVDTNIVDLPITKAQAMIRAKIIEAIREFEPRAKVVSVAFEDSDTDRTDGILWPVVRIRVEPEKFVRWNS